MCVKFAKVGCKHMLTRNLDQVERPHTNSKAQNQRVSQQSEKLFKTFVLGGGKKIQHIEGEHTVQSLQVLISTNKRQAWLQRRRNTQASFEEEDSKTTTQLW
jgi:hypothetical protein